MLQTNRQLSAQASLAVDCAENARLLQLLLSFADDHMSVDPDRVHWGHAGDAAYLRAQLKGLIVRFDLEM